MPEFYTCQNCGARISSSIYNILDVTFTCLSCYQLRIPASLNNDPRVCRHCGITIEADLDREDNLCPDCEEQRYLCDICKEEFFGEPAIVENALVWCPDCRGDATRCSWCGDLTLINDLCYDDHDNGLCIGCQQDAFICAACNCWCTEDERSYNEVCLNCEDDDEDDDEDEYRGVHDHDYKPRPNFLPLLKDKTLYLGAELETDNYDRYATTIKKLNDLNNNQYYLKADGSLIHGFEIVTHPATLEYHQKTMPWSKISEIVIADGGKSHNTRTCGLHVHFNKDYYGDDTDEIDYYTMKLLYLFERHWDNLVKFSRRRESELAEWAKRYHVDCDILTRRKDGVNLVNQCKYRGRYYAVNLDNEDTIEIRIFKGTLKVETLLACIELTAFLAEFAKKHRPNYLRRLTWYDLTNKIKAKTYPNLYKYIRDMRQGIQNNAETT